MIAMLSRLFVLACLLASPAAMGQPYPERTVTIVVTSAAGALTDTLTRAVAQRLSEMWKQSVIVENRGGAGYSTGVRARLTRGPPFVRWLQAGPFRRPPCPRP